MVNVSQQMRKGGMRKEEKGKVKELKR